MLKSFLSFTKTLMLCVCVFVQRKGSLECIVSVATSAYLVSLKG